jgi:tRNA modification GTPase
MIGLADARSTIVAIASSTSPSARGIVRIAGDDAVSILGLMSGEPIGERTKPFRLPVALQLAPPIGPIDAVAMVWPTSRSYTGSPCVELHTFGSLPLLEAVVESAVTHGARPAGPGEFTMRAFLAGRLDLTQAEAVLGVIDATSREQLDAALTQLAGNVSAPLRTARDRLLDLLADLEAGLDFVEEDISFIDDETLRTALVDALVLIEDARTKLSSRRRSESFDWVVLRGKPNAGKSSLLNALLGKPIAIVSDVAGTTRDVVWKDMNIGHHCIRLADTAGIEDGEEEIVSQSQQVAVEIQQSASIVIQCVDATELTTNFNDDRRASMSRQYESISCDARLGAVRIATKGDRLSPEAREQLLASGVVVTSALTGLGLESLRRQIAEMLDADKSESVVPLTAMRCADSLKRADMNLREAIDLLALGAGQELVAADIRQALSAIGEVTGEIYTDDVLDRVFSRFCIGK